MRFYLFLSRIFFPFGDRDVSRRTNTAPAPSMTKAHASGSADADENYRALINCQFQTYPTRPPPVGHVDPAPNLERRLYL